MAAQAPIPAFDNNILFGGFMVGTWTNTAMYTLELVQLWTYFSSHAGSRDSLALWCVVMLLFFVDTLGTIGVYVNGYMYCVVHWGDVPFAFGELWTLPVYAFTSGLSGFIVQLYLIHRYCVLSKQWWIGGLLALVALCAVGGSTAATVMICIFTALEDRGRIATPILIWLSAAAAVDVLVSACLIYQLRKATSVFKSTRSLVNRLCASSVSTGSTTALCAIASLVIFKQNPTSNAVTGIAFMLGRLYSNTMLFNLNQRSANKLSGSENSSSRPDGTLEHISMNSGIHVQRSITAAYDDQVVKTDIYSAKNGDSDVNSYTAQKPPPLHASEP